MKLRQQKENGAWILSLSGRLDAGSVAELKKATEPFLKEEAPQLIFDLKGLDFIDSTGLGALISLLRKLESKGGSMALRFLSPEVASILEITRLNKLFKIVGGPGEAP